MERSMFQRKNDRLGGDGGDNRGTERQPNHGRGVSGHQGAHRGRGVGRPQERDRDRGFGRNQGRSRGRGDGTRHQDNNRNRTPYHRDSGYRGESNFRTQESRGREGPQPRKSVHEKPPITEEDLKGKTPEEVEMIKVMGFSEFDTTKGRNIALNFEIVEEDD